MADRDSGYNLKGIVELDDAYRSYRQLLKEGYKLEAKVLNPKENPEHLKWLHTMVANAKAFVSGKLLNRIVNACITSSKITYTELTT